MPIENHCQSCGGGMSKCTATNLKVSSKKEATQAKCCYFIMSALGKRCMYEVFGKFCWSIKAQSAAVKG